MASSSKVLEKKYLAVHAPELQTLERNSVENFLKDYSRYAKERKAEGSTPLSMVDCIEDEFKLDLELGTCLGGDGKKKKILSSDDSFKAFLEDKIKIRDPIELSRAFSEICMDTSTKDVDQRLLAYVRGYQRLVRLSGIELAPKRKVELFINGIRPRTVQKIVKAHVEFGNEKDLTVIIELTEKLAKEQDKWFEPKKVETSDAKGSTPSSSGNGSKASKPDDHRTEHGDKKEARKEQKAGGHNLRPNAGMCKNCDLGAKWSKEHFAECYAKYPHGIKGNLRLDPKPPAKPINAVTICGKELTQTVTVGGERIQAVFDTGAAISCISRSLTERLLNRIAVTIGPSDMVLKLADAHEVRTRSVRFRVDIPTPHGIASSVAIEWTFAELPDTTRDRLLIGMDLMNELGFVNGDRIVIPYDRGDETAEDDMDDEIDAVAVKEIPPDVSQDMRDTIASNTLRSEIEKILVPEGPIKVEILASLMEFADVFDTHLPEQGADLAPFSIQLTRDEVIHQKARPLKPSVRATVREMVKELNMENIVRASTSSFQSPIVLVTKKSGELRMCVDYTRLNSITKTHTYPLHDMRELLQDLGDGKIWAVFDMRSSYYQMLVQEDSQEYTTFVTPDDKCMYLRVPMGCKNAPTWFQQQIDYQFADMKSFLRTYIDDMFVKGETEREFLDNLRKFLARCRDLRIRLKAPKSIVGTTEIKAVGFVLNHEGRRVDEERIRAIRDLPSPTNVTELRSFVGTANFLREFIPHAALLTQPLNELLKKGSDWVWNASHQEAFLKLKEAMCSDAVLAHSTEEGQLVVRSDASKIGCGGVLLLRQPGKNDRPIAYLSHTFTPAQRNYSTYCQELYALVFCVTQKPYASLLRTREFLVESDHRNLMWLSQMDFERDPKLARWRMILLQYDFTVQHIPGQENTVADMLSRYGHGINTDDSDVDAIWVNEIIQADLETRIKDAQHAELIKQPDWAAICKLHEDERGFLRNSEERVVIPNDDKALIQDILKNVHGTPLTGHFGQQRTRDNLLEAHLSWEGWRDDVASFVESCPTCQKVRLRRHVQTLMKTTSCNGVFDTLAIDTLGPLPPDEKGNKYLIVVIDVFSRWVELVPSITTDAASAADAIIQSVFARHGLPRQIRSDNGPQYVNACIESLLKTLEVRHHRVIPYHPQSNGEVERSNEEILRHLRCFLADCAHTKDWTALLPAIQFLMNNTVHSSTGCTPHDLVYGAHLSPVVDFPAVIMPQEIQVEHENEPVTFRKYHDALSAMLDHTTNMAVEIQGKEEKKRLARHNTLPPSVFVEGDLVLLTPIQKPSKLRPRFLGPFKIIDKPAELVFKIQGILDPSRVMDVHASRLRPFKTRYDFTPEALENLLAVDDGEYLVEAVLGHTGSTKKDVRFVIRWAGYGPAHDSHEPWSNVEGNEAVNAYVEAHPELKATLLK
jgi:hypothetical protein